MGVEEGQQPLDFSGASIVDKSDEGARGRAVPSIALPNQDADYVSHIAIDIGGSLIKLIYFSTEEEDLIHPRESTTGNGNGNGAHRGGSLHFCKFETSQVNDAIDFIASRGLLRRYGPDSQERLVRIKATGGGAFKYAELFKRRLGVELEKEGEMECCVRGCDFLLRAMHNEAFQFENSTCKFINFHRDEELFPYLLVNIGSGVSMLKVDGEGRSERVSGTNLGGGTFWGLCRLLTRVRKFDEMLELSNHGNNANVDMLVGDIYGGRDYADIGLSATTIASSFGKVVSQDQELEEYSPADIALALCRMVSYNIGHLAYLNAKRYGLQRVFFGGFFIRGHPSTMDTISYAIRFWSKGEMAAMFLRHEGFLGAMGAFLTVNPISPPSHGMKTTNKVRARFSERFPMEHTFSMSGDTARSLDTPTSSSLPPKSWVDRFMQVGREEMVPKPGEIAPEDLDGSAQGLAAAATSRPAVPEPQPPLAKSRSAVGAVSTARQDGGGSGMAADWVQPGCVRVGREREEDGPGRGYSVNLPMLHSPTSMSRKMSLHVGVLHYSPSLEPFPLLQDPASYSPNTLDINALPEEKEWWLGVMEASIDRVVQQAISSGLEPDAAAPAAASAPVGLPLPAEGGAPNAQADSSELYRRAAGFAADFRAHLQRLRSDPGAYGQMGLMELFELREECLHSWGFPDIYKRNKNRENAVAIQVLPDLLQEVDALRPHPRLLTLIQGLLAGNIFDWGSMSCVELYENGTILDIYRDARRKLSQRPWRRDDLDAFAQRWLSAGLRSSCSSAGNGAEVVQSPFRRVMIFVDNSGADIVLGVLPFVRELLRMSSQVVLVANSRPCINDITASELRDVIAQVGRLCPIIRDARQNALRASCSAESSVPCYPGMRRRTSSGDIRHRPNSSPPGKSCSGSGSSAGRGADAGGGGGRGGAPNGRAEPALFVVHSGQGSPCLDLSRVRSVVADASVGTDLVVIEGMGRCIHTNMHVQLRCDCLKLAMIKSERVAQRLFGGQLYDCICSYQPAPSPEAL